MNPAHEILKQYWGHSAFRPLQEEIIQSILQRKDTLALLPTGGGKSICFQVPAMMMDGVCIVISPLIALIKDQVEGLRKKGINALSVHAGMNFHEVKTTLQNAAFGNYKFLYLSPERLQTALFLEFLPAIKPALIAVDEAHCISQWGYDFRPAYLNISGLREKLPGIPVIALTASATLEVQNDICEKLNFKKGSNKFQQSFERPNLSYSVFQPVSKPTKLLEILKNVPGSAIVYCKSRKQTQQVSELLKMHGIASDFYHAGLDADVRNERQEKWIKNSVRVIVCTNAFGMGIDKPDVRAVVHYDIPDCLENYYQEAGRAGRDGKKSYAVLLYTMQEITNLYEMVDARFPDEEAIKTGYINLMNHLQVAAGGGEGESYSFDISHFASCFQMKVHEAAYLVQALAKDKLFSYNEMVFTPSTIEFTLDKNSLADFEKMNPALEPIIKALLRTYEGIFDFPTAINESKLASFVKKPLPVVKKELLMLHAYSVINYKPKTENPQLFLLQNRMYADDFKFNFKDHLARKEYYKKRIVAMVHYVTESVSCRSRMIAGYFNDDNVKNCGICDNCLNAKKKPVTAEEMQRLSDELLSRLGNQKLKIADLEKVYPDKTKFWRLINYLQSENIISGDHEGFVSANS